MKRRIISFVLTAAMLFSIMALFGGLGVNAASLTDADANGYLDINNEADLRAYAALLALSEENTPVEGTDAELKADIRLADPENEGEGNWIPMGNSAYDNTGNIMTNFYSNFEGNGYTISNMQIIIDTESDKPKDEGYYVRFGFIGNPQGGSTISNLTIADSIVKVTSNGRQVHVGTFYGTGNCAVTNCHVKGCTVEVIGSEQSASGVGGFAGSEWNSTSISGCSVDENTTVTADLIGRVGGMFGYLRVNATLDGCYCAATVTGSDSVGGIVGYMGTGNGNITVMTSISEAKVESTTGYAGGIAGKANKNALIDKSVNAGEVKGIIAGGILGHINADSFASIISCANYGTVTGDSISAAFIGDVAEEGTTTMIGIDSCVDFSEGTLTPYGGKTDADLPDLTLDIITYKISDLELYGPEFEYEDEYLMATVKCQKVAIKDGPVIGYIIDDDKYEGIFVNERPAELAAGYFGVQDNTEGGKLNVRFVGTVDSLAYTKAGFKIKATYGSTTDAEYNGETYYVYEEVKSGTASYVAKDFGKTYAFAVTADGFPTDTTVTFTVVPYVVEDGVEIIGNTVTVTYNNGVFAD